MRKFTVSYELIETYQSFQKESPIGPWTFPSASLVSAHPNFSIRSIKSFLMITLYAL